ncbi:MAG: helix-turn-helix domain-containing protein [Longimicrobiales bacterium]
MQVAGAADHGIVVALHLGRATVERTLKRFVEEGLEVALSERPRPGSRPKHAGKQQALVVGLACSTPPRAARGGRCNCWPTSWSHYGSSMPSPMKPCAAPSKKCTEALAPGTVVRTDRQHRIRLAQGRHLGLGCRAV